MIFIRNRQALGYKVPQKKVHNCVELMFLVVYIRFGNAAQTLSLGKSEIYLLIVHAHNFCIVCCCDMSYNAVFYLSKNSAFFGALLRIIHLCWLHCSSLILVIFSQNCRIPTQTCSPSSRYQKRTFTLNFGHFGNVFKAGKFAKKKVWQHCACNRLVSLWSAFS